jgi:methylmalonyl-CoA mutase N-terminal domain/subunit
MWSESVKNTQQKEKEVILESGIKVKPVYTPEDVKDIDYNKDVQDPGKYPYTRGIHPYMYRARPWTMRQYSGFATARETNKRFKYLIEHGQTGLNVAFDLPTQMGLDSDDPRAEGEVGRVGMAVDTLKDMEYAFEGIPLDKISTSLTINSTAAILLAMYIVVAEKQGLSLDKIRGTAQNDILKEYIGRGTWIFPVEPSLRLITDTIEYCSRYIPNYYPVSVCGYHIRESGANPVQEIAYAYCIAKAYIQRVLARGIDANDFISRISFNFDIHGNFFEQIAKFRAARRLWAKIVKNEFGATNPKAMMMKMIAGGGGGGLTIEQPENNIVRGAYYALISALSGTQTMALCSYDEAYTIPSEKAALISLRTMQILIEEMGLCDTADPLGGSYYVEALTNQIEEKIVDCMNKVEERGGIVSAISEGLIQKEVSRQAYLYEKMIQSGELVKVGVNKYQILEDEERTIEFHEYDPSLVEQQIKMFNKVKSTRDNKDVSRKLDKLRAMTQTDENLMPYIIDCVRVYATVGEITMVLKEVFGEFEEPVRI